LINILSPFMEDLHLKEVRHTWVEAKWLSLAKELSHGGKTSRSPPRGCALLYGMPK
tara:strand:+ start:390 stop:557 length:168 start_codon:yes stop_codon:yes gene_type:complete